MRLIPAAVLSIGLLTTLGSAAQSQWTVTKTFPIGGAGAWDYLTVDSASHRLFVPRTTHTMIIDENTGKVLGDVPGQKGAHGVAVVPTANRGFITDGGGTGAIVVFDLTTYAILGSIPTVPDSDGIIYDAKLNRVLAVSGDEGVLMSFAPDIDPNTGKAETIQLGGKPEFLFSDGTGKVFINLEDKDTVAVVDLASHKVVARWPVAPGGAPVGMSSDGTHLFIGCRNPQKLVIMNIQTGKVEGTLPIGPGVDATIADGGRAFASSADGSLVISAEKGGKFEIEQTVKTPLAARTMGIDRATHRIFMPTADLDVVPGSRPKPKPGTFKIVVVEQK